MRSNPLRMLDLKYLRTDMPLPILLSIEAPSLVCLSLLLDVESVNPLPGLAKAFPGLKTLIIYLGCLNVCSEMWREPDCDQFVVWDDINGDAVYPFTVCVYKTGYEDFNKKLNYPLSNVYKRWIDDEEGNDARNDFKSIYASYII